MLFSDVRSDKIGKNAVDRFSISPLVLIQSGETCDMEVAILVCK